jgi:hypothetical protein
MYPKLWKPVVAYQLVDRLIELAMQRKAGRLQNTGM